MRDRTLSQSGAVNRRAPLGNGIRGVALNASGESNGLRQLSESHVADGSAAWRFRVNKRGDKVADSMTPASR